MPSLLSPSPQKKRISTSSSNDGSLYDPPYIAELLVEAPFSKAIVVRQEASDREIEPRVAACSYGESARALKRRDAAR